MAKVVAMKRTAAKAAPIPRVYALARETRGTWLMEWQNAPADTPDWAKKWYLLKSDFPVLPHRTVTVRMTFE